MKLKKVCDVNGGEWCVICPICSSEIDTITAGVNSYETECECCDRWYFLADAVCAPLGHDMTERQIKLEFSELVNKEANTIQVEKPRPRGSETVEGPSPVLHRMEQTLKRVIEP